MDGIVDIERHALSNATENPGDFKSWSELSFIRSFTGNQKDSIKFLDRSMRISSQSSIGYMNSFINKFSGLTYFPGFNIDINRYAFNSYNQFIPHVAPATHTCISCGSSAASWIPSTVSPDFDVKAVGREIFWSFVERALGICQKCGLIQNYNRMSDAQIDIYVQNIASKDATVSEEIFHSYPVPEEFVSKFEKSLYELRLKRWGEYFSSHPADVQRAFFLRPNFGLPIGFAQETFGAECSFIDISDICSKTVLDRFPGAVREEGNIHGNFSGRFLERGPYDAIFCFHSFVHTIDPDKCAALLKSALRPGGFILFTHEINVKPHNPFHMNHWGEKGFVSFLKRHFKNIVRIGDCDQSPPPHIAKYTKHGDSPDFIAF